MAKAIHMMIRVLDETKSVDFYRQALGLEIADRFAFDDFTLVYMRTPASDFEVELTINHGRTEPYTHGSGYGHLAVSVDNVDAEHRRLEAWAVARGGEEFSSRRRADGKIFLPQDGRFQNRSTAATRPIRIAPSGAKDPACHRGGS
jgi:catechol 2,3-dioxygenase-like lactoylglutathione lyase family enzyme